MVLSFILGTFYFIGFISTLNNILSVKRQIERFTALNAQDLIMDSQERLQSINKDLLEIIIQFSIIIAVMIFVYMLFGKMSIQLFKEHVRVIGFFGWKYDIPIHLIDDVKIGALKGIKIYTKQEVIKLICIPNSILLKNIIEILKQINPTLNRSKQQNTIQLDADMIEKYKKLLDMGAITEEEYNLKKKQILGL